MGVSDVRRHHLSVVLGHLVRAGPRSRADLAQDTGLTKATVSLLVADLLDRELVEELDTPRHGRVGRPATDVAAAGRGVGGLGLEIDVDRVAASVVDLTGEVRAHRAHEGDNRTITSGRVIDRLRKVAGEVNLRVLRQGDPRRARRLPAPDARDDSADPPGGGRCSQLTSAWWSSSTTP
jgi:hypothetical protein